MKISKVSISYLKNPISFKRFEHNEELFKKHKTPPVIVNSNEKPEPPKQLFK